MYLETFLVSHTFSTFWCVHHKFLFSVKRLNARDRELNQAADVRAVFRHFPCMGVFWKSCWHWLMHLVTWYWVTELSVIQLPLTMFHYITCRVMMFVILFTVLWRVQCILSPRRNLRTVKQNSHIYRVLNTPFRWKRIVWLPCNHVTGDIIMWWHPVTSSCHVWRTVSDHYYAGS